MFVTSMLRICFYVLGVLIEMSGSQHFADSGRQASGAVLPVLRLLMLSGLGVSAYLLYLSLSGAVAAGCGEGDAGCNEILSSTWSVVFGLPVAGLALAIYLVMIFVSVHAGEQVPEGQREKAWRIMAVLGVSAGASGLWFIGLQLSEFDALCPYCMVVHGCSLLIAASTLWRVRGWLPWLGVFPAVAVALAQGLFNPASTMHDDFVGIDVSDIKIETGPLLGDPDAPKQIVLLYDYNCRFCRNMHAGLKQVLAEYPDEWSIRMLPTALDPACNHAVEKNNSNSETSCELTRLALAVWIADPDKFSTFDLRVIDTVGAGSSVGSAEEIVSMLQSYAGQLVGHQNLEDAFVDPRLERQLDLAAKLYAKAVDPQTGKRGLPRVVVSGHSYAGIHSADRLIELLDKSGK